MRYTNVDIQLSQISILINVTRRRLTKPESMLVSYVVK